MNFLIKVGITVCMICFIFLTNDFHNRKRDNGIDLGHEKGFWIVFSLLLIYLMWNRL